MELLLDRKITIKNFERIAFESKSIGITEELHCDHKIIISLTTYNKRTYDVYLTIESILQQTVKPNKIVLWLSKDEFSFTNLPISLKRLRDRGVDIEFCEEIKSYKKLIPTLKMYGDEIIITIDDDIIYPCDFVENMLSQYLQNPSHVYYYRGRKILMSNGELLPYAKWRVNVDDETPSLLNLPTGVGGVIYPPKCFHDDVFNEQLYMSLAPSADDIWFKAMTLLNNIKCKRITIEKKFDEKFISLGMQDSALFKMNKFQNDSQMYNVFKKYDLLRKLDSSLSC